MLGMGDLSFPKFVEVIFAIALVSLFIGLASTDEVGCWDRKTRECGL